MKLKVSDIDTYLRNRDAVRRRPTVFHKAVYNRSYKSILPVLNRLENYYIKKVRDYEIKHYKKTGKLHSEPDSIIKSLNYKIQVCNHYQHPVVKC